MVLIASAINNLENEVFCISDFSNLVRDTEEYEFFSAEFKKANMEIPCIFFFKVYDALMSVLKAINRNPEVNREELNRVLHNLGKQNGVLGSYEFKDGAIIKPFYILKFSNDNPYLFLASSPLQIKVLILLMLLL